MLRIIGKRSSSALKALEVLNVVVGAVLFFALAVIAWPALTESVISKEYFGVQGVVTVPEWPFRALLVLGSFVAAVAYLTCIPSLLRQPPATGEQA